MFKLEGRQYEAAQRKEVGLFLVSVSLDVNPYCDHVPEEALLSWAGYPATHELFYWLPFGRQKDSYEGLCLGTDHSLSLALSRVGRVRSGSQKRAQQGGVRNLFLCHFQTSHVHRFQCKAQCLTRHVALPDR